MFKRYHDAHLCHMSGVLEMKFSRHVFRFRLIPSMLSSFYNCSSIVGTHLAHGMKSQRYYRNLQLPLIGFNVMKVLHLADKQCMQLINQLKHLSSSFHKHLQTSDSGAPGCAIRSRGRRIEEEAIHFVVGYS